jgi:hypothetical protein
MHWICINSVNNFILLGITQLFFCTMDGFVNRFLRSEVSKQEAAKKLEKKAPSIPPPSPATSDSESEDETKQDPKQAPVTKKKYVIASKKVKETGDSLFDSLEFPAVIVIIGKSKQGKSHLMRSIVKRHAMNGGFKAGIVFTQTKFNGGFDFMPDNLVISGMNANMLKRYLNKMANYRRTHDDQPLPNFIIFDDMARSVDWNEPLFSTLINTPRHFGSTIIICCQYAKGLILPNVREQADYAFIFQQKTIDSLQASYSNFGSRLGTFDQFKSTLDDVTSRPHHCLVMKTEPGNGNISYEEYCAPAAEPKVFLQFGKKPEKKDDDESNNQEFQ